MWSRIHLIPLLTAEEDRDQVRRYYAQQAMEKELLGAETKAYNSDRSVLMQCARKRDSDVLMPEQIRATDIRCGAVQGHGINARPWFGGSAHCTYGNRSRRSTPSLGQGDVNIFSTQEHQQVLPYQVVSSSHITRS